MTGMAVRDLKDQVKRSPFGPLVVRIYRKARRRRTPTFDGSSKYWDERYRAGRTSGSGSYGRLAHFKADVINSVIDQHHVSSVLELGCGDGNQLGLLRAPCYVGVDVSPTAIERCRSSFGADDTKRFYLLENRSEWRGSYDLALSLDVIYHLVEDDVFDRHMAELFSPEHRLVLIYSSNHDEVVAAQHVRHRSFTNRLTRNAASWTLLERCANRYPFDPQDPDETSFSDFYLFERVAPSSDATPNVHT